MKLISRYMLRSLVVSMLFVTVSVSCAVWLTQSIRFLQMAVGGGAPFTVFLELVVLSLPNFVSIVLPIALLSIILFIYNKMSAESELVVMRAAGMHTWTLAKPALWLGLGMSLLVFAMNGWIGPISNRSMKQVRNDTQSEYTNILLKDGVFNTLNQMTIFVRDRDANGDLLGLLIQDDKDPKTPRTIVAKRGVLMQTELGPRLQVYNGQRQELDHQTQKMSRLDFDDYAIDLKFLDPQDQDRWLEPTDRTLTELLTPNFDPRDKGHEKYIQGEANIRIASPLFMLDFTLIGLACLLVGEFDRRGQSRRILRAIFLAVSLQLLSIGMGNLSRKYMGGIWLLYLTGLAPMLVCAWFINIRSETLRPQYWRLPWQRAAAA
jgi:lipopolysaccharide export system permease protein